MIYRDGNGVMDGEAHLMALGLRQYLGGCMYGSGLGE